MRHLFIAAIAGLALTVGASESQAQFRPGFYSRNYYAAPAPYYYGPPVVSSNAFVSPYGYATYSNYAITPGLFGYNTYATSGTYIRPYVMAPLHSVTWDPFSNTYRYGSGSLNTPNYYYSSGYPY